MPTGFLSVTDQGNYQIDSDYRNMLLVRSGQFRANWQNTVADLWYQQLLTTWQNTTPYAMLATRCVYPNMMTMTPGTYRNGMKITNFFFPQGGDITFQYYIYDLVPPNPAHNYGMQIFDPAGALVYSALDYPLKVIAEISTLFPQYPGTNNLFNDGNPNRAYAGTSGGYTIDLDTVDEELMYFRTWWSGTTLQGESQHYTNDAPGQGPGFWGTSDQFGMVIDTTGLPANYSRYG